MENENLVHIPQWMFDAALCAKMRIDTLPRVECDALHALKSLCRELRATAITSMINHEPSHSYHGDVDGNQTSK
jgi:hypothetical protein